MLHTYYSPSETVKNIWGLLFTKLFFKGARLIRRPIYIRGRKWIQYQSGFTTGYGCRFDVYGDQNNDCKLYIGKQCRLGDRVHIVASQKVTIGDNCLFASNIFVSDTNHGDQTSNPNTAPADRDLTSNPVQIGDNVWVGEGVSILPGTTIGNGCIIGAHSVVNSVIPDYCIAVGAPAKVVKEYNFQTKQWERVK